MARNETSKIVGNEGIQLLAVWSTTCWPPLSLNDEGKSKLIIAVYRSISFVDIPVVYYPPRKKQKFEKFQLKKCDEFQSIIH